MNGRKAFLAGGNLSALVLAIVVFGITAIPYMIGFLHPLQGMVFGGLLPPIEDQDAYFSFIRQAADGHWLFVNRLTSMDHDPVFINPQWWLVGRIMAWLDDSDQLAYQIWRAAGALAVMFGFSALAAIVVRDHGQRRIALLMCAFGGGFWWLQGALRLLGRALPLQYDLPRGMKMDLLAATHPFHQIMVNPHHAIPLGLFLFFCASYAKGELTGNSRWYLIAAAIAVIEGTIRPYELIAMYTAIPLFLLIELVLTREFEPRRLALRILPLVAIAPVFLYNVYIFRFHHVLKYWGSQGKSSVFEVHWQLLSLGLAGVLVAIRLGLAKTFPLKTSMERLLLAWIVTVLFFCHAHKFPMFHSVPYTFQLVTTIMPPVILLGVVVLDPARWAGWSPPAALRPLILAAFVAINALSSAYMVTWFSRDIPKDPSYYVYKSELEAYKWMARQTGDRDVVLCTRDTGRKLARYTSVRVVTGHWSVTPNVWELEPRIDRFYKSEMNQRESEEFLEQLGVNWIYWGRNERIRGGPPAAAIPGFEKRVINQDVILYSSGRGGLPKRGSRG
jgi:hypothetical protein